MRLLVLILSKKHLKANHNVIALLSIILLVGFNIVKETFESKSQHSNTGASYPKVGFNIVKETFESKSQPGHYRTMQLLVGFNIVKETFESKSQPCRRAQFV